MTDLPLRILLISLYYPPEVTSNGVLMQQLARRLRDSGHDISVIAAFPQYSGGGWWPIIKRSPEDGISVWRVRVPAFGARESFITRAMQYLIFNTLTLLVSPFTGPADVVFTLSPPLTNGIVSRIVALWKRAPSVYNVQDLVPEAYVQFGVLKNRTVIRLFERLERRVYRKNTILTVISNSFRDHLLGKGVPSEKIEMIPNFVDTDEIRPLPRENALSARLGLEGKFAVMHAGSIAYRHGVEVLVDAAKLLVDLPGLVFVIVGEGSKRHVLDERAREANLPNLRIFDYVDRVDLPLLRATADVQMIVLRRGHTSHSVPSKVYEIMASGRPFVAAVDEGSTIWEIAREADCGLTVAPESAEEIARAVRRLYQDRALAAAMGERGRSHAAAHYSAGAIAAQYDALFRRMTASKPVVAANEKRNALGEH